ncbi:MAG: flagellar basal-body MS-ring/collar protein FliF [Candidatus Zixiibacteriota bacterium]
MGRWWDAFRAMDANRRFLAVCIIVALIAGAVTVGMWVRHVTYGVLYTRLPAEEAGEVIDQLDQMKVPYRLSDGGSAVLVPANKVHDVRLRLAAEGLPRGAVGFELFDKSNLGMTDFLQKVNYRRALEGELAKSIATLKEVAAVRVHIVMPESRLFTQDQKSPTASVVLKVSPVGSLDRGRVAGITHLVASAVEGLNPQHVTVIDQNGTLLSSGQEDGSPVAASSRQLELQQSVEGYLQQKAQSLLDGVLGPRKAMVRVNATLNFEQAEKTVEQYDPDNLAIVSQEQTSEKTTGDAGAGETDSEPLSTRESSLINYEVNRTVQKIVSAVGAISRLSVSVIVDGVRKDSVPGSAQGATVEPRPQEDLDRISALVKAAIGFQSDRNDAIEVVSIPFDTSHLDEERRALDQVGKKQFYYDIAYKVGYGLLILAGAFFGWRIVKKMLRALKNLVPPVTYQPRHAAPLPTIEDEAITAISTGPRKAKLSDQMGVVAKERPQEIAKVIKTLMVE